jgi:hypothetical protein
MVPPILMRYTRSAMGMRVRHRVGDVDHYVIVKNLLDPIFQHTSHVHARMGTLNINNQYFYSVRLPTQGVTESCWSSKWTLHRVYVEERVNRTKFCTFLVDTAEASVLFHLITSLAGDRSASNDQPK